MKIKHLIAALAVILFTSCDDILFEQPQPPWASKNESTFPENVRGIYAGKDDTIRISEKSISPLHPKKDDITFTLSDSLILRVDKDSYYLNMMDEKCWVVTLGKLKGDSLITYTLSGKDESARKAVGEITRIKEMKNDSGRYFINPTAEEFRKILDKNLFKRDQVYLRIRDKR